MHVKFGALMTDARGKIGGHVFSNSLGGAVLRTNSIKSHSFSQSQNNVKSRLAQISQLWSTLTQNQVKQWNKRASMILKSNVFGDKKTFTGFAFFQECNNTLSLIGSALISTPVYPVSFTAFPVPIMAATVGGVFTATWLLDPVLTGLKVLVYATAPTKIGRKIHDNDYYLIGVLPTIVAHVADLSALYLAKFTSLAALGQQLGVKFVVCDAAGGQRPEGKGMAVTGFVIST